MATVRGLLKMEGKGVLQNLIPNVGHLEIAYILFKGWIIGPDVHGLLDGSGNTVSPPYQLWRNCSTLMQ